MKVIKLDGRHNLYGRGFRYAFVSRGYKSGWLTIERMIKQVEGVGTLGNISFIGKPKNGMRSYYLGFKKESTATAILLKI